MRFLLAAFSVFTFAACVNDPPPDPATVKFGESQGLAACDDETVAANPDSRCFTWRAVAGVSMGGGTAARMGFAHPEIFDVVADMGGPTTDMEFFTGMIESNHMGGFCSKEKLDSSSSSPTAWTSTIPPTPRSGAASTTRGRCRATSR
jgi:hypothetical protein